MVRCFGQDNDKRGCFDIDLVMRVAVALDSLVGDPKGYRICFKGL